MSQVSEMKGAVLQHKGFNESQINGLNSVSINLIMGNIRTGIFFSSIWNTAAVTAVHSGSERSSLKFPLGNSKRYYTKENTAFHKTSFIL